MCGFHVKTNENAGAHVLDTKRPLLVVAPTAQLAPPTPIKELSRFQVRIIEQHARPGFNDAKLEHRDRISGQPESVISANAPKPCSASRRDQSQNSSLLKI